MKLEQSSIRGTAHRGFGGTDDRFDDGQAGKAGQDLGVPLSGRQGQQRCSVHGRGASAEAADRKEIVDAQPRPL
jgi:hypothetical protein